jgi:uncharacterized ParB-like nuclease family protein
MPETKIKLSQIDTQCGTQLRATIDDEAVSAYAEVCDDLPCIDVFLVTEDGFYAIVDGFHRYFAHEQRANGTDTSICVNVVGQGTIEQAIILAAAANETNGLRRTNNDKRTAVRRLIEIRPDATGRQIAQWARVSHTFVQNILNESTPHDLEDDVDQVEDDAVGVDTAEPESIEQIEIEERIREAKSEFKSLIAELDAIYARIESLAKSPSGVYISMSMCRNEYTNLKGTLKSSAPTGICPKCDGAGCEHCAHTGWVSRYRASLLGSGGAR